MGNVFQGRMFRNVAYEMSAYSVAVEATVAVAVCAQKVHFFM